eukprot:CAMPEP_0118851472 /NCGR_PEP_ID=MMETSP1163-20130328/908_1 /TAXON_ID=124430 /ORGANISM="Phaeomonas parva, Strain CCMP2877" /LENGTH=36 /DNA_ID= /DNA_START= /DNA_END= /DNA_ORIENTATION=
MARGSQWGEGIQGRWLLGFIRVQGWGKPVRVKVKGT